MSLADNLIQSTVRITAFYSDGKESIGSGFLYSFLRDGSGTSVPCIITNRHVLQEDTVEIIISMTTTDNITAERKYENIRIRIDEDYIIPHPNEKTDLAVLPIAPLLNDVEKDYYNFKMFDQSSLLTASNGNGIGPIEDVLMIGYPTGLWDQANNRPIVRKGITATHALIPFNSENIFFIDMACFPGSSGSPIIWWRKPTVEDHITKGVALEHDFKILGVLFAGPQFDAEGSIIVKNIPNSMEAFINTKVFINLGYCVMAKEILLLEDPIKDRLAAQ